MWRGRSPSHDHEVPPIANAARSTIRKSVPVFAEETGTGTEERRAFGVGSVSKIKSTAVQLVGKVVRRPVSTASWGGVHFFDPVLLIARKNLFYWLRVDPGLLNSWTNRFFFFCQAKLIFVHRWSLCSVYWSSLVQIFKNFKVRFYLGLLG